MLTKLVPPTAFGLWLTAFGLWLTAFGLWLTAFGLWLTAFGLWLTAFGLWLTAFGLWRLEDRRAHRPASTWSAPRCIETCHSRSRPMSRIS